MNGKIQNSIVDRALVLAFIGWVAVLPNRAEVMSVVFGPNPIAQSIPFEFASGRMQQIYPSSLFDATPAQQILISGISFHASQPFVTDVTGMRMLMAQTAAQETVEDFSANLGGGAVEVLARGDYTINASSLSAVIPMPKGFVYDRTQGNLIVDIQFAGNSQPGRLEFSYSGGVRHLTTFDADPNAALGSSFQSGGLRTEFTFTAIPEPSVRAMLMIGGISAWFLARGDGTRRRVAVFKAQSCLRTPKRVVFNPDRRPIASCARRLLDRGCEGNSTGRSGNGSETHGPIVPEGGGCAGSSTAFT